MYPDSYRIRTLVTAGNGEQFWLCYAVPLTAWSIAEAEEKFAKMLKSDASPLSLNMFDRTGAARFLSDDDIDLLWTGAIKAERLF